MEQLDLFSQKNIDNTRLSQTPEIKLPVKEEKEKIKWKVMSVLSWIWKHVFSNGKYESYKIEKGNWKIKAVYFQSWKYKFLVNIDYDFKKSNNINFYETDKEEREILNQNLVILNIEWIQKKVKVWYDGIKPVNYFRYAWLDYNSVKSFLEALIKDFHK